MTDRDAYTAAAVDLLLAAEAALAEGFLADGGGPVAELATSRADWSGRSSPSIGWPRRTA